jgi:hypothetical protein
MPVRAENPAHADALYYSMGPPYYFMVLWGPPTLLFYGMVLWAESSEITQVALHMHAVVL